MLILFFINLKAPLKALEFAVINNISFTVLKYVFNITPNKIVGNHLL